MVGWSLSDAGRRLREWNPQIYAVIFGNESDASSTGGLVRGAVLTLLGLFFLYRYLTR